MSANHLLTIPEIVEAARAALPEHLWDYSCGGSDTETTLRRNRAAFDRLAFRPRVLRGTAERDLTTTFLGQQLDLPVMLAPIGSVHYFDSDGALACARGAEAAGTATFVGSLSTPSLEEVRAESTGPLVLQVYALGNRAWLQALIERAERAGYMAICITTESAMYGRRERDLHHRFAPRESLDRPNLAGLPPDPDGRKGEYFRAALNWDDIAWLREHTRLPIILKGIMTGEDAELAVEHGAACVYVSNHGGRQLDHVPATLDVLPEIAGAVAGRAEVIVDGGFLRGTDALKALALGARAVLIGKLMLWGLAAGGSGGVARALELLRTEMSIAMANLGVRSLAELSPAHVRPSYPPGEHVWPITPGPQPPKPEA